MDTVLPGIFAVPLHLPIEVGDGEGLGKSYANVALYAPDDVVGRGIKIGPAAMMVEFRPALNTPVIGFGQVFTDLRHGMAWSVHHPQSGGGGPPKAVEGADAKISASVSARLASSKTSRAAKRNTAIPRSLSQASRHLSWEIRSG